MALAGVVLARVAGAGVALAGVALAVYDTLAFQKRQKSEAVASLFQLASKRQDGIVICETAKFSHVASEKNDQTVNDTNQQKTQRRWFNHIGHKRPRLTEETPGCFSRSFLFRAAFKDVGTFSSAADKLHQCFTRDRFRVLRHVGHTRASVTRVTRVT